MNMELPKVSVVTITYGHEKYITETLDGVLMQQYKGPVEFIIANDNSPDATDEVVKKYFLENPAPSNFEIKYTKHETNKGMMPNFIWALEQATGKYIALCEGDDYWTDPLKLQKQTGILEKNANVGLIFTNIHICDRIRNEWTYNFYKNINMEKILIFENHLKNKGYLAPLTWVIRKNLLSDAMDGIGNSVDGTFVIALNILKKSSIYYLRDITGVKNEITNSASNQKHIRSKYIYFKGLFETQKLFMSKFPVDKTVSNYIYSENYFSLLPIAIKLNDEKFIGECRNYLLENNMAIEPLFDMANASSKLSFLTNNWLYRHYTYLKKKIS